MPGFNSRTASIVRRKWSAPPSERSSRATAVMTTCFRRIRRVASATRSGSSASKAKGLAVVTAQKWQARVQRSPPIMNVAVPLLQHSQWFGHLALSHTVCSLSSSSSARVREKLCSTGNFRRNHSGNRGRTAASTGFKPGIVLFQAPPKFGELFGAEIREDFPIYVNHRRQFLAGKLDHFVV